MESAEEIIEDPAFQGTPHSSCSALTMEEWDPLSLDLVGVPQHKRRVELDIMDLLMDPLPGVHVVPVDNKTGRIHALVVGPADTPYEGGFFHFLLQCPKEYPFKPPRVRLMNTDGGRVRFNPKLYATGMVRLDILDTFPGLPWNPAMRLKDVLVSIRSLLLKRPYVEQPGIHGELREGDSERYNHTVQHETIRVAVCDIVEGCLKRSSPFPLHLRRVIFKTFLCNYKKYAETVKSNLNLTGTAMCDVFGSSKVQLYQYRVLLVRLFVLRGKVRKLMTPIGRDRESECLACFTP
ncbi:hypothetical protein HPB50_025359 [Hyalomma asiaticum]|uniref:Uncharacterized protein n=1 Tax=Hyalomma asiaticum TaxID=266040 RepID=A0ACB7RZ04_HYAAI|nr:hypothetical protein HPB50_025359 [Hyalomma asiaticum]